MKKPVTIAGAMAALMVASLSAYAADHQVLMLDKDSAGRSMQFEPAFIKVMPGDTVTFVPQGNYHNSESISNGLPQGAQGWKGKQNEEVKATFDVEGFYAYKCQPHVGMGMVGLIQVGEAGVSDPAMADKLPPLAKARLQELVAEAQKQ